MIALVADHKGSTVPNGKSLAKLLRRMSNFAVAFRFTPEGVRTKVTLELEPEEQGK